VSLLLSIASPARRGEGSEVTEEGEGTHHGRALGGGEGATRHGGGRELCVMEDAPTKVFDCMHLRNLM
jgi:hypothetical protein